MAVAVKAAPKGLTVRKKKARPPAVRRGGKKIGPSFDGWEKLDGYKYGRMVESARSFYYEHFQSADLEPDVWEWMKANDYSVADIRAAKAHGISINIAIVCRMLNTGMPDFNPLYATYWEGLAGTSGSVRPSSTFIRERLAEAIEKGSNKVVEEKVAEKKKVNVYVPTIQERMREVAYAMADEIDEAIDSFITDPNAFDPASYKIAAMLRGKQAKAAHARLIKNLYVKDLAEYTQLVSADCPKDLMEGYTVYGKKNIKKMFDFLTQVVNACDQIAGEAKIARAPRAKKAKPAEDQVKKIKFKATDDRYNIASVPASQLVGAVAVVVFNTKTRKLGFYVADSTSQVLGVKGTSIIGFDTKRSVQKTLRKPELQLKEFKAIGTQKRMQTWFEGIKTTETVLNGRINAEVMILKVWK